MKVFFDIYSRQSSGCYFVRAVLLLTFLLGCACPLAAGSVSDSNDAESAAEPNETKSDYESWTDKQQKDNNDMLNDTDVTGKLLISIFVIIVLGFVAFYLSRKVLPRVANMNGKEVRVVETVHLGNQRSLHLVEVSGRRFLLGSTSQEVSRLAEIGGDISETLKEIENQESLN